MPYSIYKRSRTFLRFAICSFSICGLVMAQLDTRYSDQRIVFPDRGDPRAKETASPASEGGPSAAGESLKSLQLAKKIDSINSIDDFLKLVKGVPQDVAFFSSSSRMGETERSNAERPNRASCMPELQTVPLLENEPSVIYYPTCTRVKRCGGCCSHSLLSCQPTATEIRNFEIFVTVLESGDGLKYQGKRIVPIEEHTQCTCDCKIKETDCNKKQSYIPEECTCTCNNVDEQKKCNESNMKMWHPDLCSCFCREVQECSTGFYFDQNSCRCLQVSLSRTWFTSTKGSDYRFGQTQRPDNVPPVIIALDSDDPRRKPKPDPE
ncbi:vascular endothelial growth factor A, long form [Apis cerana]|uniref:vascular endothelial growth factor A, long form n=1 Tax=Apis cerana TaxID=7461 RepID=UPI002B239B62|nr:vascular endothelial growth factor A, long form [Apis cerana]